VSISSIHVAPVVVKPLIVSKKALGKSIFAIRRNGTIPINEKIIQESATTKKLSARVKRTECSRSPKYLKMEPNTKAKTAVPKKTFQPDSPQKRATMKENPKKRLSIMIRIPKMLFFTFL
jgi:hypothetical protein